MAFQVRALSRFATSDRGRRAQANFYGYSTADDAATIQTSGYFNAALDRFGLKAGDQIDVTASVDATPSKFPLTVTSVFGGIVTVVASSVPALALLNDQGGYVLNDQGGYVLKDAA